MVRPTNIKAYSILREEARFHVTINYRESITAKTNKVDTACLSKRAHNAYQTPWHIATRANTYRGLTKHVISSLRPYYAASPPNSPQRQYTQKAKRIEIITLGLGKEPLYFSPINWCRICYVLRIYSLIPPIYRRNSPRSMSHCTFLHNANWC